MPAAAPITTRILTTRSFPRRRDRQRRNSGYSTAGTTFRVWAPNATAMHVSGTWNGFSTSLTPLFSEGNGNWSADVPGATNTMQYQYFISNSTVGTNVTKQDPRARRVVNSAGNGIILQHDQFQLGGRQFRRSGLSNAVIYELCIGSFNDPNSPNNAGTFMTRPTGWHF